MNTVSVIQLNYMEVEYKNCVKDVENEITINHNE